MNSSQGPNRNPSFFAEFLLVNPSVDKRPHSRQVGLQTQPERTIHVNGFDRASGESAVRKLLSPGNRPDGLFIFADQCAFAIFQMFHKLGIGMLRNIAINNFTDIPEAAIITPSLTTISPCGEYLGRYGVMMLNDRIARQTPEQRHVTLPGAELVIRQSCSCQ